MVLLFGAMEDFVTLRIIRIVYQIMLSIIILQWAFKFVGYLCNWTSFRLIVNTLKATVFPLSALFSFYLVLFVSIAGLFTLTAGSEMYEVSQYWNSFILTVRYLNDDFDYDHLTQYINEAVVFAFYCFFLFGISFVVLNMFIAIILDIYAEQKAMVEQRIYRVNHLRELWYALRHVKLDDIIKKIPADLDTQHEPIFQNDLEQKYGIDTALAALIIKEFGNIKQKT